MKFKIIKDNISYDAIISISLKDKIIVYKVDNRFLADDINDVEVYVQIEKEWKKII
jgi:hypothetical protein